MKAFFQLLPSLPNFH